MGIFSWFFSSQNTGFDTSHAGIDINPANGLPMVDGSNSVDIMGNPYGTDFTSQNGFSSHCGSGSGFDSSTYHSGFGSDGFSSGGGSSFGGGFSGGFGGGMNDW